MITIAFRDYFIKVKPANELCIPEKHGNWFDLKCAETINLLPNTYIEIPLGVCMQLPSGYEAIVAPRSSTFKKYGIILVNSIGIIDSDYFGDNDWWRFPAYCTKLGTIEAGTRIAQFRILYKQPSVKLIKVESLGNPSRGGLGSTGD